MNNFNQDPGKLRKYIYEYALIALGGCVVFLFFALTDLNKYIRTELIKDRIEMTKVIERNTEALNNQKRGIQ